MERQTDRKTDVTFQCDWKRKDDSTAITSDAYHSCPQSYCPSEGKETGGHTDMTSTEIHVANILPHNLKVSLVAAGWSREPKDNPFKWETVHPNQLQWALFCH